MKSEQQESFKEMFQHRYFTAGGGLLSSKTNFFTARLEIDMNNFSLIT